jgi:hypothetical protein
MASITLRETANVNSRATWFSELFGFSEACGNAAEYAETKSKFTVSSDGNHSDSALAAVLQST